MARKRTIIETSAVTEAIEPVEIHRPEPEAEPEPILNRGPQGWVKVRAKSHLGELDRDGNMRHRNPGDVFEVTEARANAIGGLVTRE